MKKILATVLAALMLVALLAACGGGGNADTPAPESSAPAASTPAGENQTPSTDDEKFPPIKIGISCWDVTGQLALEVEEYCKLAADALGVEMTFISDGFVPETQIENVQNLVAQGCDAVFFCNSSEAILPTLIDYCDQNQVYFGLFMRTINDAEIRAMAEESEYFIGVCHEDEYNVGYLLGHALADKGATQVGFITWNRGDAVAEARYAGYKKAFEERGVTIIAEAWEVNTAEQGAAECEKMIAAYPEMDGVVACGGGGEPLAGIMSALENQGLTGKIPLVSSDFGPDIAEQLQNGEISAMTGGHAPDAMFVFMLLYNYAVGAPLSDEGYVEISMTPVVLASYEDAMEYNKWCKGEVIAYTAEEIQNMSKLVNPDFTIEELKEIAASYSVADVAARHADLVG